jgi:hypothetical protein
MVPTLSELTGQRAAIGRVLELQSLSRKECVLISGPGGSGVSWALDQIGIEWERNGGVALKATGTAVTPKRPFLPWLTIASPARNSLARWDIMKGSATEASKAIPVVGGAAGYVVGEVLNYRRKKLAHQAQMLGEKEQDLMFVIEATAHGKRLLLLIDQLSNWDDESWALLELIVSPVLHDLYPTLANILILAGANEEILPRCRVMMEKLPVSEFKLNRLQRGHLPTAMKIFSFPLLGDQEQNVLYEATGGRLDLLHDFASFAQDFGNLGPAAEKNVLYGRMIERRLRAIKGNINALEELLSAASFLGNSFSLEEIGCLTGSPLGDIQAVIRQAEEEKLLAAVGGNLSFPSSAMQRYFLSSRIENPAKYHSKFSECLRRMRPGDYEARCQHLLLAGQHDDALACYCLAFLDARRRRKNLSDPGPLRELPAYEEYKEYLDLMTAAYREHDRDALNEGLAIIESIEAFLSDPLIAERDYLEAQIRMKSHRIADLERVVALLQRWLGLKEVEPEIWSRIAQTLMVALSETSHYEEARQLEEDLTKYYGSRRRLDPWALYGLNCLRRQSECLHHLVPSRNRLENALAYFGPTATGILPRHPLQYYYTLTNLVANLIASGSFPEATVRSAELERLLQNHPSFDWPSLEVAANNTVLAGYLAGILPLTQAIELMRKLDDGRTAIGDRILIQNNLAVLFAHDGQSNEAKQILVSAREQLGGKADSDSYHRYFIANNLAGLLAISGDIDSSLKIFDAAGSDLHQLFPAVRETLLRRHSMMFEALKAAATVGMVKFDRFLKDHHPPQVGPQWEFYGRGFLFTDIQFWTSD